MLYLVTFILCVMLLILFPLLMLKEMGLLFPIILIEKCRLELNNVGRIIVLVL